MALSFQEIILKSQELAKRLSELDPKKDSSRIKALGLMTWANNLSQSVLREEKTLNQEERERVIQSLNNLLFLISAVARDFHLTLAENYIQYLNQIIAHLNRESLGKDREGISQKEGGMKPMEPLKKVFGKVEHHTSLIPALRNLYDGDLVFPNPPKERPYVFANFVHSVDGITSYDLPGHLGGGDISRFNPQDTFIMGLLRCLADGVAVGANTLRLEPEHLWTSEFIAPEHKALFKEQRWQLGKSKVHPYNIFVTARGKINFEAVVFQQKSIEPVIIIADKGYLALEETVLRIRREKQSDFHCKVIPAKTSESGEVDIMNMLKKMRDELDIAYLLVEGGSRFYGSLEKAGCVDELFLTISPIIAGNSKASPRPTLSGFTNEAYTPQSSPTTELISVKIWKDYLFVRRRYRS